MKIEEIVSLVNEAATNLSAMMDTPAAKELGVRHALPNELDGCALMLRDETQTLRAEKEWLYAENQRLRACVRSARADEAHCWARRVDVLSAQVEATDKRCTQLLQSMAWGRSMSPAPAITVSVDALPGMSPMNRTIAYCAADTLRKLGYAWNGEAWVVSEQVQKPVAWIHPLDINRYGNVTFDHESDEQIPLYAVPQLQQRKPRGKMHSCDDPLCAVCGHGIAGEPT